MADDDPDRIKGSSCTATLDVAARTLTFEHRGWFLSKAQKASPIVVPLDEIISVEYGQGKMSNWLRITRRGQEPWKDSVASDPNGMNCATDPTEFAERVKAAVGVAAPAPVAVEEPDQLAPTDTTNIEAEPKPDGAVVKAVDGVLGFFSKWN